MFRSLGGFGSVDCFLEYLYSVVLLAAKEWIPRRSASAKPQMSWWTPECLAVFKDFRIRSSAPAVSPRTGHLSDFIAVKSASTIPTFSILTSLPSPLDVIHFSLPSPYIPLLHRESSYLPYHLSRLRVFSPSPHPFILTLPSPYSCF